MDQINPLDFLPESAFNTGFPRHLSHKEFEQFYSMVTESKEFKALEEELKCQRQNHSRSRSEKKT